MSFFLSALNMAWRNLWRNQRRSLVTLGSLAFGFAAVAIFAGYTQASYTLLANSAIHAEWIGHVTVNKNGWLTQGKLHPGRYMLTQSEVDKIRRIVHKIQPGAHVIPRMFASGLLSNGQVSTIFMAMGVSPADQLVLRGPFRDSPGALDASRPNGVTLAQGLADTLELKRGDAASVFASTVNGQANALDVDVTGFTNTGNAVTNDRLLIMPIELAQQLMDTQGKAATVTLLLPGAGLPASPILENERMMLAYTQPSPNEEESARIVELLSREFKQAGLDLQVRGWQEMSTFYRQVRTLYNMIFAVMLAVVLTIVVLSIFNAMSMAVIERTREIGTLRAMGLRRTKLVWVFLVEALLLIAVGIAAGLVLMLLARAGVNWADIRYNPPSTTIWVPLYIGFDWAKTGLATLILSLLALIAAYLPARRAAHHPIIDSLAHV